MDRGDKSLAGVNDLRLAIAESIAENVKAYNVPGLCESLGLAGGSSSEAQSSKRMYVNSRLQRAQLRDLVGIAERLLTEFDDESLREVLIRFTSGVSGGSAKNLIFAADGPKPEIVLSDAINNDLTVVRNEEFCLVYRDAISRDGLTWATLAQWWARTQNLQSTINPRKALFHRLCRSLASPPEQALFHWTCPAYPDTELRETEAMG